MLVAEFLYNSKKVQILFCAEKRHIPILAQHAQIALAILSELKIQSSVMEYVLKKSIWITSAIKDAVSHYN